MERYGKTAPETVATVMPQRDAMPVFVRLPVHASCPHCMSHPPNPAQMPLPLWHC